LVKKRPPFGAGPAFEESMTRMRKTSATAVAVVLGLTLAAAGCGKYSWASLKAQKDWKDGGDLYRGSDWKGAAAKFESALASDPGRVEIYFYLGNSYDNMYKASHAGEPENDAYIQKAIENYQKAAEQGPNPEIRKLALQYLVAAYGPEKLNDPSKAEPIVQKMISVDPNDPANYTYLSKIYQDAGRYDEAEQTLLKARDVKPNDPLVYTTLAGFYNSQGEFEKTMEALNKAAELEPKNPQGYQMVGTYYWEKAYKDHRLSPAQRKEYIQKGLEAVDKALALNPDYAEALTYKNILLRMQGNEEPDMAKRAALFKEADQLKDRAIELNKKRATGVK
jgi:tetratricopeptide (TPR) repeat protein